MKEMVLYSVITLPRPVLGCFARCFGYSFSECLAEKEAGNSFNE